MIEKKQSQIPPTCPPPFSPFLPSFRWTEPKLGQWHCSFWFIAHSHLITVQSNKNSALQMQLVCSSNNRAFNWLSSVHTKEEGGGLLVKSKDWDQWIKQALIVWWSGLVCIHNKWAESPLGTVKTKSDSGRRPEPLADRVNLKTTW